MYLFLSFNICKFNLILLCYFIYVTITKGKFQNNNNNIRQKYNVIKLKNFKSVIGVILNYYLFIY